MDNQNKLQLDKIHIVNYKLIKGQINDPLEFDPDKAKKHAYKVDLSMEFDVKVQLVKMDFNVEIVTESGAGQKEEARGIYHLVFIFHVENLNEQVYEKNKKGDLEINGDLGNALASITYSTSRGILMIRLQGTALSKFILPVVDPDSLLEKSRS